MKIFTSDNKNKFRFVSYWNVVVGLIPRPEWTMFSRIVTDDIPVTPSKMTSRFPGSLQW